MLRKQVRTSGIWEYRGMVGRKEGDVAVSDVRLTAPTASWLAAPRLEARMRLCSDFNTLGEGHWEVRVKVACHCAHVKISGQRNPLHWCPWWRGGNARLGQ